MELNYIIFFVISVLTVDSSNAFAVSTSTPEAPSTTDAPRSLPMHGHDDGFSRDSNMVKLPTYSVYLIGFTMLLMLIAIVLLAAALYFALTRKGIFGLNANNKQYVRQESTGVTPIYNTTYDDQNKNNGSTLTVNSGVIEISEPRPSNPTTPTRIDDISSKVVFTKKPMRPIVQVICKGQMDAICKEVLTKVQKSDSASFRDLNELLKFEKKNEPFGMKSEDIKESEKENKDEDKPVIKFGSPFFKLKKLDMKMDTPKEITSETLQELKSKIGNNSKLDITDETKQEAKNETATVSENKTKPDESKDVRIEVNTVESAKKEDESDSETEYDTVPSPIRFRHSGPEPEQEDMYDTVPNPMRFRHSGPERDLCNESQYDIVASTKRIRLSADTDNDDLDDIPLYDLPPRRSQDGSPKTLIQMDPDSHYLVPISTEKTDSCYVNAKKQ